MGRMGSISCGSRADRDPPSRPQESTPVDPGPKAGLTSLAVNEVEGDPPRRSLPDTEPRPPQGLARKMLLILPAALFIFLLAVLIWGILADLLAGY
jgi:hypothetical protein